MYYYFQVSQDFKHGEPVLIIQSSRLLWHKVHLLNPPYCLSTSDLDMTQHWLNSYQSVAMARWHITEAHHIPPGMPKPWSVMHPDQSAGQWHVGPSFRPTIFCLACVGLLNIAETLKSVSGFMARGTWLGPTICCLVWMDLLNLCTFA